MSEVESDRQRGVVRAAVNRSSQANDSAYLPASDRPRPVANDRSACLEPDTISERLVRGVLIRPDTRMLKSPLTLPLKLNGSPNGIFHFLR